MHAPYQQPHSLPSLFQSSIPNLILRMNYAITYHKEGRKEVRKEARTSIVDGSTDVEGGEGKNPWDGRRLLRHLPGSRLPPGPYDVLRRRTVEDAPLVWAPERQAATISVILLLLRSLAVGTMQIVTLVWLGGGPTRDLPP